MPTNPQTHGVRLAQIWGTGKQELFVRSGFMDPTHVAYPAAIDAARTAVIEAARNLRSEIPQLMSPGPHANACIALIATLDVLTSSGEASDG
ncbi:MAG: hypothetical protein H0X39_00105 [Actinobacteria bacterium]|nr:hypothetical protein [Actinomycetota bacterium]